MIAIGLISELAALSGSLPAPFKERAARFPSPKRQASFLAGRVLLQMMLQEKGIAEKLPHIAQGAHGKPYFDRAGGPFFNISHSGGLIAVSLCQSSTGIDLEQVRPRHNLQGLEDRELNEGEMAFVKEDPSLELERFTALWTLRECLVKVTGIGLAGLPGIAPSPREGTVAAALCPAGTALCSLYPALPHARTPMWLTVFCHEHAPTRALWASAGGFSPMEGPKRIIAFSVNP